MLIILFPNDFTLSSFDLKVKIDGKIIFPKGIMIKDKAEILIILTRLKSRSSSLLFVIISGSTPKTAAMDFNVKPFGITPASIRWIVLKDNPDFSASSACVRFFSNRYDCISFFNGVV